MREAQRTMSIVAAVGAILLTVSTGLLVLDLLGSVASVVAMLLVAFGAAVINFGQAGSPYVPGIALVTTALYVGTQRKTEGALRAGGARRRHPRCRCPAHGCLTCWSSPPRWSRSSWPCQAMRPSALDSPHCHGNVRAGGRRCVFDGGRGSGDSQSRQRSSAGLPGALMESAGRGCRASSSDCREVSCTWDMMAEKCGATCWATP